ncbi:hypothetical protein C8R43DRAFT_1106996 [Mycena crocata]|nr:hypothetical protein C8R43DRAFT_1106996 [Mycena crocata]
MLCADRRTGHTGYGRHNKGRQRRTAAVRLVLAEVVAALFFEPEIIYGVYAESGWSRESWRDDGGEKKQIRRHEEENRAESKLNLLQSRFDDSGGFSIYGDSPTIFKFENRCRIVSENRAESSTLTAPITMLLDSPAPRLADPATGELILWPVVLNDLNVPIVQRRADNTFEISSGSSGKPIESDFRLFPSDAGVPYQTCALARMVCTIMGDVISLVVQGVGDVLAATAVKKVTITAFVVHAGEFLLRFLQNRPVSSPAPSTEPRLTACMTFLVWALVFNTTCLYIRAVYHVIELADGWTGRIIHTQFDVLNGAMIVLAIFTLNIAHTGFLLDVRDPAGAVIPPCFIPCIATLRDSLAATDSGSGVTSPPVKTWTEKMAYRA